MRSFQIGVPDDFHVHFRQGDMLKDVVPYTSRVFRRALAMPNTTPAILTAMDVKRYRDEIKEAARDDRFEPLMTIKLAGSTTPTMIEDAKAAGIAAAKLYPEGVTTNSEDGIPARDIEKLYPVFAMMESCGAALSLHGEVPGVFVLDREERFLEILENLAQDFPKLRIVLEHITTAKAAGIVRALRPGVAATITLHHLMLTLDDVLCDKREGNEFLNPHHYCKPVAKTHHDRRALLEAALSGDPKFFFGSDSAPHLREKKESDCGCAGVWSAPVILPLLLELFEEERRWKALYAFTCSNGAAFYRLPENGATMMVTESEPYDVPPLIHGIVPFWAGKKLKWNWERKKHPWF